MSDGQLNFPGDAPDPPVADYAEDYSRGMKKKLGLLLNPPMDWTWNRRIFSTI
jgi:hypothetical protein